MPISMRDALRFCGGELLQGAPGSVFGGVSIDTRTLRSGDLFVAIHGPNHDAHDFLADATRRGAAGLLIERGRAGGLPEALPAIGVDDTTRALGALAGGHRRGFRGALVAVTGSSGKTTSKEMCAAILSVRAPCLKTEGNLNNTYGLPLTLLRREAEHESAVVELGMSRRGEIAALAAITLPTVALITNIGTAHIEFLGSREAIAQEKGDLFASLRPEGIAVVNRDDDAVVDQAARASKTFSFAQNTDADVRAESVRFLAEGAFAFELLTPDGVTSVRVAGLADTTVINALGASAAALAAGATLDEVAEGLASYAPVGGRMARVQLGRDVTLIDDSYNANPQSMQAALESLARLKGAGRSIAVLGDMAELGSETRTFHERVGRSAAELEIDFLFAVGQHATSVADGARRAGMDPARIHVAAESTEIGAIVREILRPRDWILVKGSRAMKMERVVDALAQEGS